MLRGSKHLSAKPLARPGVSEHADFISRQSSISGMGASATSTTRSALLASRGSTRSPACRAALTKRPLSFSSHFVLVAAIYRVLPLLPRPSHAGRGWHDSPRTLPRPVAQSSSDGPSRQGYALITGCCLERSLARYSEGKGGL